MPEDNKKMSDFDNLEDYFKYQEMKKTPEANAVFRNDPTFRKFADEELERNKTADWNMRALKSTGNMLGNVASGAITGGWRGAATGGIMGGLSADAAFREPVDEKSTTARTLFDIGASAASVKGPLKNAKLWQQVLGESILGNIVSSAASTEGFDASKATAGAIAESIFRGGLGAASKKIGNAVKNYHDNKAFISSIKGDLLERGYTEDQLGKLTPKAIKELRVWSDLQNKDKEFRNRIITELSQGTGFSADQLAKLEDADLYKVAARTKPGQSTAKSLIEQRVSELNKTAMTAEGKAGMILADNDPEVREVKAKIAQLKAAKKNVTDPRLAAEIDADILAEQGKIPKLQQQIKDLNIKRQMTAKDALTGLLPDEDFVKVTKPLLEGNVNKFVDGILQNKDAGRILKQFGTLHNGDELTQQLQAQVAKRVLLKAHNKGAKGIQDYLFNDSNVTPESLNALYGDKDAYQKLTKINNAFESFRELSQARLREIQKEIPAFNELFREYAIAQPSISGVGKSPTQAALVVGVGLLSKLKSADAMVDKMMKGPNVIAEALELLAKSPEAARSRTVKRLFNGLVSETQSFNEKVNPNATNDAIRRGMGTRLPQ